MLLYVTILYVSFGQPKPWHSYSNMATWYQKLSGGAVNMPGLSNVHKTDCYVKIFDEKTKS